MGGGGGEEEVKVVGVFFSFVLPLCFFERSWLCFGEGRGYIFSVLFRCSWFLWFSYFFLRCSDWLLLFFLSVFVFGHPTDELEKTPPFRACPHQHYPTEGGIGVRGGGRGKGRSSTSLGRGRQRETEGTKRTRKISRLTERREREREGVCVCVEKKVGQ